MSSVQSSARDDLLQSWQYVAHTDFTSYAHWDSISSTSHELRDKDGEPASIIVVGQVILDKSSVGPLGNFETQEEKQQRTYRDNNQSGFQQRDFKKCQNAKLVVVIRRPTNPLWASDYDTAIIRLNNFEKSVAKANGPRQWFVNNDQTPPTIRFTFPLWEKKKYTKSKDTNFLDKEIRREDDVMRSLREEDSIRGKKTAEYCSYLADEYVDAFRTTQKTHNICIPPIFLPSGDLVEADEYAARLDNAILEVMFSLRHYYYPNKGKPSSNTFTAVIEQIKILHSKPPNSSPIHQPVMKSIAPTPPSQKGKQPAHLKRAPVSSPTESSPSAAKKIRMQGPSSSSTLHESTPSDNVSQGSSTTPPPDIEIYDSERGDYP